MKWLAEIQIRLKSNIFTVTPDRNNWPKVGHPIQHKALLLLPFCQILHMVLQNKGGTPKKIFLVFYLL